MPCHSSYAMPSCFPHQDFLSNLLIPTSAAFPPNPCMTFSTECRAYEIGESRSDYDGLLQSFSCTANEEYEVSIPWWQHLRDMELGIKTSSISVGMCDSESSRAMPL